MITFSSLQPANRPFLLYCPTNAGDHICNIMCRDRLYDIALNDFSGQGIGVAGAEWQFKEKGHKWHCASRNLEKINMRYEHYGFLDNDIEISGAAVNTLFLTGYALQLSLYQAALSHDSITVYGNLKVRENSYVRSVPLVEIMMPFFSMNGLQRCFHTFGESESGWGLDIIWPRLLSQNRLAVVDAIVAKHTRPVQSKDWILSNGLTPFQEMIAVCKRYGVNPSERNTNLT